jgi:hypothetical protein
VPAFGEPRLVPLPLTQPPKNLQGLLAWPEDYPEILFLERTEVLVPDVVLLFPVIKNSGAVRKCLTQYSAVVNYNTINMNLAGYGK